MNDRSDIQLLRDYAERQDEAAFREIVIRYTDLVYSAASRQVESADLAADIAQSVFVDLARKAKALAADGKLPSASLAGWLHRATRFAVLNQLRDARRRTSNERLAMQQLLTDAESSSADWEQIRPILDEALDSLRDDDREALLLRYFKNHNFRDVGTALGISDDAAQKRVTRAVDQLRDFFSKRKVSIGATGLVVLISANAVQAAPVALAAAISTAALSTAAVSTSAIIAATKTVAMTTLQKTLITATIAVVAGAGLYQAHQAAQLRDEVRTLRQQQAALTEQMRELQAARDSATNRSAALADELAGNNKVPDELLRLRGEVGRLRQENADAKTPITHDMVEARYKNGQDLARSGDAAGALKEFLWCFDEGMPRVPSYGGVRTSFLLSSIAQLGEKYPPALSALRDRRDKALQRMLDGENDSEAAMDFAALNRTLKEEANTLALFDQLAPDDRRRQSLASIAYNQFVEAQRYGDAILGRPYATMNSEFEMGILERPLPTNIANPERLRKSQRDYLINATARNIEVLAGAGDLEHARTLAGRLLAYDTAPETRVLLQQHATRAGQPDLLDGLKNP